MINLKTKPIEESIISNCTLKSKTTNELTYHITGDSMLDYTKESIIDGVFLKCENDNLISPIIDGTLRIKDADLFIFSTFNGNKIVAKISNIHLDYETITLSFLNPNKEQCPDISFQFDDIKSIFKVKETIRLMGPS